ncbi:MAG: glycosyl transferase family 2 [Thermoplasmata archaeon HGW-Thermoplasmata-1]|nr:MAG: glycosyl transferase family 2 [Thermoplasmata archaeon HGW-Thermoplasmata-1]
MKVSVVLPTLNEEKGIGGTIDAIKREEFKKRGMELEILVIDGNSRDRTREIAESKGAKVVVERRKGYGRAYKTGFPQASGDVIVTGDADETYPFDEIHNYIDYLLENNLDFITTDRFAKLHHGSMSRKHAFGNWTLSATAKALFPSIKFRDSQSGMWIFKKNALDAISPLESMDDGMPFSEEIKIEMFRARRVRAKEIPSKLFARAGEAKIQSFSDGWKNLSFLFRKRFGCRHCRNGRS